MINTIAKDEIKRILLAYQKLELLRKLVYFFRATIDYLLCRTDVCSKDEQDTVNNLQTLADANKEPAADDVKELLLLSQNLQEKVQ